MNQRWCHEKKGIRTGEAHGLTTGARTHRYDSTFLPPRESLGFPRLVGARGPAGRRRLGLSFAARLAAHPVLVEVVPPSIRAKPAQIEDSLKLVGSILEECAVDAVNVPEILGSAFQSMDPLDFGRLVRERFSVDVVVNKVVVHDARFEAWVDRVLESEICSAVLVGGERSGIYYPGPSVLKANRLAKERAEKRGRRDFPIGNITIPARPREAARMVSKAQAGCDYFTSQIVYESPTANAHLQAFDDVCALSTLSPKPLLYAFSPAETQQDILFLRYLGVNVPAEVEEKILAAAPAGAEASIRIIEEIWANLLSMWRERHVTVPLGVIVETVSKHNATATTGLVRALQGTFAGNGAQVPAGTAARKAVPL